MGEWGPAEDGPVEAVLHGSQPGSDLLHEGGDAGPVSHVYPPEKTVGIMSRALFYVFTNKLLFRFFKRTSSACWDTAPAKANMFGVDEV